MIVSEEAANFAKLIKQHILGALFGIVHTKKCM